MAGTPDLSKSVWYNVNLPGVAGYVSNIDVLIDKLHPDSSNKIDSVISNFF